MNPFAHAPEGIHFWRERHLWPLAVGWPLTLAFGAALVYGARSRHWVVRMALAWVVLAFMSIGGLHTKHVRYLLPLLPFLSLVAADMFWRWAQWRPRLMGAGLVLLLIYSGGYGIAFARIYTVEDSRIRAGRWMAENAPPSAVIGVENGGFSLREMIDRERHRERVLPTSTLFGVRGYLLCESTRLYLQKQLRAVDYIAITDVNRYRQFLAVPELYPAVAGFYKKLVAGELGFSLERRFKTYPSLLGWDFRDDGAEPSFLGYDHPTVWILQRTDDFERAWEVWARELVESPRCGDARARKVAAHVKAGSWAPALDELEGARQVHPDMRFLAFVEAHIHGLRGDVQSQRRARDRYLQGLTDQTLTAALLPWATSLSLMQLGLFDLSLQALETSTQIVFPDHYKHRMADRCLDIAKLFLARNDRIRAAAAYRQSMEIEPRTEVAHTLGDMAYESGRANEARQWWKRALKLDPQQWMLYKDKGRDAYERGHRVLGLEYLGLAVQYDPQLTREQKRRDFNILAEIAQQSALVDQARIFWRYSLELDSAQVEVQRRLQRLGADDADR